MVERGSSIPHFEVTTVEGRTVRYSTIWQHRNLLLVALPESGSEDYVSRLADRRPEMERLDAELVATHENIPGVPRPTAVVADRWGEVMFIATPERVSDLPAPDDLLEWLSYIQVRCPECEGESR